MDFLTIIRIIAVLAAAYLLGSINSAIIVSKTFKRKDIRELGSKNAGTTNAWRTMGKTMASLVFMGDVLKGVLAIVASKLILSGALTVDLQRMVDMIAGLFVVVGHISPVFFGFRGGKGIATGFAVVIMINPVIGILALGVFLIVLGIGKMISLASMIASCFFPIGILIVYGDTPYALINILVAVVLAILVIYMHRENIKRIRNKTESKILTDTDEEEDEDEPQQQHVPKRQEQPASVRPTRQEAPQERKVRQVVFDDDDSFEKTLQRIGKLPFDESEYE